MSTFEELAATPYISLATFRKSGAQVATPVWAAAAGDALYVFSAGNAGKVKRLRNSQRAQLASCSFNGALQGEWQDAIAEIITDAGEINRALAALRHKYGWQMWLADIGARLTGKFQRRAYIRVTLTGASPSAPE